MVLFPRALLNFGLVRVQKIWLQSISASKNDDEKQMGFVTLVEVNTTKERPLTVWVTGRLVSDQVLNRFGAKVRGLPVQVGSPDRERGPPTRGTGGGSDPYTLSGVDRRPKQVHMAG
jgi:hypothetical protein